MNEHDVIRFFGRFPDAINPPKSIMDNGIWKCGKCGKLKPKTKEPCECGSVFWTKAEV